MKRTIQFYAMSTIKETSQHNVGTLMSVTVVAMSIDSVGLNGIAVTVQLATYALINNWCYSAPRYVEKSLSHIVGMV